MIGRSPSIRYGNEDRPELKFDNQLEDEDVIRKNSSLFLYNSEEDIYRLNSLKKTRIAEMNESESENQLNIKKKEVQLVQ